MATRREPDVRQARCLNDCGTDGREGKHAMSIAPGTRAPGRAMRAMGCAVGTCTDYGDSVSSVRLAWVEAERLRWDVTGVLLKHRLGR